MDEREVEIQTDKREKERGGEKNNMIHIQFGCVLLIFIFSIDLIQYGKKNHPQRNAYSNLFYLLGIPKLVS